MSDREYTKPASRHPFPSLPALIRGGYFEPEARTFSRIPSILCGIGALPLYPFAKSKPRKVFDPNRGVSHLGRLLDHLGDFGFLIDHKDLFEQRELFIKFAQASLDHSLDDRVRLATGTGLLAQDLALAVERRFGHRGNVQVKWICRRRVHR